MVLPGWEPVVELGQRGAVVIFVDARSLLRRRIDGIKKRQLNMHCMNFFNICFSNFSLKKLDVGP